MMSIKAYALIALGILFLMVGINMKYAEKKWDEVVTSTEEQNTKEENAAIGAGLGAVVGGGVAAVVGGVGIVVAGTGIGLPAGAALIAISASIGAVAGGIGGAATGEKVVQTVTNIIPHVEPAYETWQWGGVIFAAVILFSFAIFDVKKRKAANRSLESE